MFEKNSLLFSPIATPMGFCSASQCKKACNGGSGNAIADVEDKNTDPSGE